MAQQNPKDIYSSFHTLYKFFHCVGILPFDFDSKRRIYRTQNKRKLISFVTLTIMISLQLYLISCFCFPLQEFTASLQILLYLDCSIIYALLCIFCNQTSPKLIVLFKKIADFDRNVKFTYVTTNWLLKYFVLNCTVFLIHLFVEIGLRLSHQIPIHTLCLVGIYQSNLANLLVRTTFGFFINEITLRVRFFEKNLTENTTVFLGDVVDLKQLCKEVNWLYNFPLARNFGRIFVFLTVYLFFFATTKFHGKTTLLVLVNVCFFCLLFCEGLLIVRPVQSLCTKVNILGYFWFCKYLVWFLDSGNEFKN